MNFSKLKKYMDYLVNECNVPGVDCMVCKNHEVIYRYWTGMSDIENNKKMNGDELFIIYSMTKMITCTAALQLFEKGKYKMEDPLSKYLPDFEKMKISYDEMNNQNAESITTGKSMGEVGNTNSDGYAKLPITIKDLFTMSAGLDYDLADEAICSAIKQGKKSTRELVGAMSNKVLGFEPGTRFRYSLCHDVLGALIEIWSGQKLSEYLSENIFKPLNMKDTFFDIPTDENLLSRMAVRYSFDENNKPVREPFECVYNLSEEYESGGAGLTSTTEDYATFLDALACGGVSKDGIRILNEETVKLMKTNHLKGKQCDDFYKLRPGYGYGLGVRTHVDQELSGSISPIGEFGWDGAAGAFSIVDTDNKLSFVYFQELHAWGDKNMQINMRNALYEDFYNL